MKKLLEAIEALGEACLALGKLGCLLMVLIPLGYLSYSFLFSNSDRSVSATQPSTSISPPQRQAAPSASISPKEAEVKSLLEDKELSPSPSPAGWHLASNFTVEVTRAWIDREPHIEGKTNLPDGDELEIDIFKEEDGEEALARAKVSRKQFRSGKCSVYSLESLLPGRYIVEITALDQDTEGPIYVKAISIGNSRKAASSKKAAESKTIQEIRQEQRDRFAAIETRVREVLTPILGQRLEGIDNSFVPEGAVRVSFRATGGWRQVRTDMRDAYAAIFTSDAHASDVVLIAYGRVMDQLGHESTQIVYATRMNEFVAKMINWENKDYLDFTKLWTTTIKEDLRWEAGEAHKQ